VLHFVPEFETETRPQPYAEAVARLASIRHVLRLVDNGSGPADDFDDCDQQIAFAWDDAGDAKQRCFDTRSGRVVASTAEGLEALLAKRDANPAANQRLAEEIRLGLADLSRLMLGGPPSTMPDSLPIAL
jgi:hypothetical protein